MSVELLDGGTIVNFVEDKEAFGSAVRERFRRLDIDGDGVLSYAEMLEELQSLRVGKTRFGTDEVSLLHRSVFEQFDRDSNGKVDLEEFMAESKKIMVAIAEGLGFLPIQMALEEDSFLMRAVERESGKAVA